MFFSLTAFQIYNKNDMLREKMKMFVEGRYCTPEVRRKNGLSDIDFYKFGLFWGFLLLWKQESILTVLFDLFTTK